MGANYNNAKINCESDNAHLAVMDAKEIFDKIISVSMWTGLTKHNVTIMCNGYACDGDKKVYWLNGEPLKFATLDKLGKKVIEKNRNKIYAYYFSFSRWLQITIMYSIFTTIPNMVHLMICGLVNF